MNTLRNLAIPGLLAIAAFSTAQAPVPKGTEVDLRFTNAVSSRTAKVGDTVGFTVANDVLVNGRVVIHSGARTTGTIEKVDKNGRYGKNARLRIAISPINGIPVEPRDKGQAFGGSKTNEAAAATGGAALIFGPVGLAGGYFIVGKPVNVRPGAMIRTVVSRNSKTQ